MNFAVQNKVGFQEPAFQLRLIRKFSLPADARNVEVFLTLCEENGMRYYEGVLKWEVLEDALEYDSSLGRNELVSQVKSYSRPLGRSDVDWVSAVK